MQDGDAVAQLQRLLLVVRDEEGGHVDVAQQCAYLAAESDADLRVERAEGLVEEEHLRLVGESARNRDALLLPAGELRGELPALVCEVDEFEQALDLLLPLAPLAPADAEAVADVLRSEEHTSELQSRV